MSYDETQGERVVRESARCLLAESCLLYQFATRMKSEDFPRETFYCPAADRLFHETLGDNDPELEYVFGILTPLANCYRMSDQGEWIDG